MLRIIERGMPFPSPQLGLQIANRKTRKLIRESCPNMGIDKEHIYWTRIIEDERLVYVTVQKDINHYIVITCFKYKL